MVKPLFKFQGNYSNFFRYPNIYEFYGRSVWAASWQNQQNSMCALRRLRSAWSSTQSDQSIQYERIEETSPQLPIERTAKTDQTGRMPRLIRDFAGRICHFTGFVTRRLVCWLTNTLERSDVVDNLRLWTGTVKLRPVRDINLVCCFNDVPYLMVRV